MWLEVRQLPPALPRPVLFLDRDGVIVEDRGHVGHPDAVALLPGAAALIAEANARAISVAIVTNQSGIARGLFDWHDFAAVQARIDALLAAAGAHVAAVAACPFHPAHTRDYGAAHAAWRKPGPRMIAELATRLNVDRPASWMVGDSPRDIAAARDAGLGGAILVGAGTPDTAGLDTSDLELHVCATVADAAALLRAGFLERIG